MRVTSSTAQGGGGSFKSRKPSLAIGEVGCCESRMAERRDWWTDRSFSDYLPTYLPTCLPAYLPTYLNMSLVLRLPRKMHLCKSSSNATPAIIFGMRQNPHVLLTLDKVHNPLRLPRETTSERPKVVGTPRALTFWLRNLLRATTACTFSTSQLPKVIRTWCASCILTSKSASRHNSVHFFDILISKSGPRMVCFVHFDFEMFFAPQQRALFRHLNFQKWSENGVLCAFWLGNVLRATTACNFSSLIWPAGSAPAALASLLFDPPEPQIIGKTQCFATFLPFRAPASSFFWLFLFSDLLSSALLFSILLLHLCFSSVHIVGSLTSKLPSINQLVPLSGNTL